ncbi:MAG: hypothetical protein NTX61_16725 [Bacteroidetes bacterium]|nr:hypothetical protein [Bacteroidota bacterium]
MKKAIYLFFSIDPYRDHGIFPVGNSTFGNNRATPFCVFPRIEKQRATALKIYPDTAEASRTN